MVLASVSTAITSARPPGSANELHSQALYMVYPNPQIYDHLRAIFVHVPKCAGTSIENALKESQDRVVGGHTTALGYRRAFPEKFRDYFKFAIVRHPADRLVSAFNYLRERPINPALNNQVVHEAKDFRSFVVKLAESEDLLMKIVHLMPQHCFVCDPTMKVLVDKIFRFEAMTRTWTQLCRRYTLNGTPLPKRNASSHAPWQDCYDPASLQLVASLYQKDFALFGYSPVTLTSPMASD